MEPEVKLEVVQEAGGWEDSFGRGYPSIASGDWTRVAANSQ